MGNQWMPLENSKSGEIRISISFTDLETRDSENSKSVHFKDVSTSESKTENLPSVILALKEENGELQSHIPEEILSNLPPEFREMLQAEVVKARQTMLEEELEKPKTKEKENESPEVNKNTTEVEEILDLVKDLDEDTSKFIYEQLQTILVEIDQELKQQKMKDLHEELIQLQIQQNKIMPGLPDDLISSLPKELSDELQKSMKDAYLKMASTNNKENEVEHDVTEVLNNDEKDLDNKPTVTITSDEVIMSSIPEDLLANLPPEMANALKLNFASSIKMLSTQNDKDGESEEEDDVSLPPTPAVQTPWSVVANQPARPSGPTPDSELREDKTTGPFDNVVKKQTTVVVKEERKISNNVVKRTLFPEDYEGDKQTLKAPEKDYRSVSPEIIEVAKSTVEKGIEGAKIKVTEISGRETEHTGDIDLTGTNVPAENTSINPDLLDIAQEAVVNIIEDAKTKVVNIKTKESKDASNKSMENFHEVEIIKNRISKDEDRFSRTSVSDSSENNKGAEGLRDLLTTKTDSTKEPKLEELVNPDLLIGANKTVSGIIESAKQQVTEMNSKDEKSTANKNKQEQVKKMIDDFFKSDDEDDEEDDDDYDNDDNEPISVRMAICKKEEETSQSSNDKAVTPVLLEVAKETVSNVIDTAKVKVARINQEQGTNKSDQQIKTEKSIENVGATGLKTIISEVENTDESASIVKETQETKRVKGLGVEDLSKQKQVQTMITEALSPDGEEDQESEPIAVRMAICKKEDETTNEEADNVVSNVESGKLKDFKEESNGAIGLRSFLTEGKGSKPGEIETTVTDISKLTQVIIKGSLKLKVIKAKHLKNMDMVGKSDPYVSIQYGDKIVKSKKKKSTLDPEWNWETKIDLDDANSNIFLTVFDSDKIGHDEKMGSLTIKKETLNQFRSVNPTWLTFEDNMPGEVLVLFDFNDIQEITVPPTNNTTVKPVVSLEHREESKRDINITSNTVHKNTDKDQGAEGLKSFLEGDKSKADIKDNSGKDQSIDPSKYSNHPTSPESNEGAIGLRKILNTDQSKTKIKEVGISIEESKMVPPKTTYLKDESVSTTSEEPVKTSEQLQKLPSKNENVANEDNKSAHKESSKPKVQQKLSESNEGAVLLIQESDSNENKKVPVSGQEAEGTIPEITDIMKKRTQKESVQSESKDEVLGLKDILQKTTTEKVDGKLEDKLEKEKENTEVQKEEVGTKKSKTNKFKTSWERIRSPQRRKTWKDS